MGTHVNSLMVQSNCKLILAQSKRSCAEISRISANVLEETSAHLLMAKMNCKKHRSSAIPPQHRAPRRGKRRNRQNCWKHKHFVQHGLVRESASPPIVHSHIPTDYSLAQVRVQRVRNLLVRVRDRRALVRVRVHRVLRCPWDHRTNRNHPANVRKRKSPSGATKGTSANTSRREDVHLHIGGRKKFVPSTFGENVIRLSPVGLICIIVAPKASIGFFESHFLEVKR